MIALRVIMPLSVLLAAAASASAWDLTDGCSSRAACSKVCKLVCEKSEVTVVAYGCKCEEVCLPAPSHAGCKHGCSCCPDPTCDCNATCKGGGKSCHSCDEQRPIGKFSWRDWFPRGCGESRQVKKLVKFEVTREIYTYHWEVVAASYGGAAGKASEVREDAVYKPAPANAAIGVCFELTEDELAAVFRR